MIGQFQVAGAFVGRSAELARLRQGVELALAGANACAWVVGEAGIGKTRLVHELATYARLRGAVVRWSDPPGLESATLGDGVESLTGSAPGSAELIVIDGVETAAARATALERLRTTGPTSRFVLGTSRHPPTGPLAALLDERSVDLIVLGGLDADTLGRLFGSLSEESLDRDLLATVVRTTQGNPGRTRSWFTRQRPARSPDAPDLAPEAPTPRLVLAVEPLSTSSTRRPRRQADHKRKLGLEPEKKSRADPRSGKATPLRGV